MTRATLIDENFSPVNISTYIIHPLLVRVKQSDNYFPKNFRTAPSSIFGSANSTQAFGGQQNSGKNQGNIFDVIFYVYRVGRQWTLNFKGPQSFIITFSNSLGL